MFICERAINTNILSSCLEVRTANEQNYLTHCSNYCISTTLKGLQKHCFSNINPWSHLSELHWVCSFSGQIGLTTHCKGDAFFFTVFFFSTNLYCFPIFLSIFFSYKCVFLFFFFFELSPFFKPNYCCCL